MKSIYRLIPNLLLIPIAVSVSEAQWVQTNGPFGGKVYSMAEAGNNLFAGTYGGVVFRSTDSGDSWIPVNNGLTGNMVISFAESGDYLFAGTNASVFRSSDNGDSWINVNNGLTNIRDVKLAVSNGSLFVGVHGWITPFTTRYNPGGMFRSTDSGNSWSPMNNGLTNDNIRAIAVSGNNVFAGTDGGVFRSVDNGNSWVPVNNGLTSSYVYSLDSGVGALFVGTYHGVFRSTDAGATWIPVNNGLISTNGVSIAASGAAVFAGTNSGGVFRSSDSGNSWFPINNGLLNTQVYSLTVSGANLFAGVSDSIVWRRPLSDMLVPDAIRPTRNTPMIFGFGQNGMVHARKIIEFAIPHNGWVNLNVYDSKGKKAATLVNAVLAPGTHHATFDGTGLSGGIYFLRIQAKGFNRTQRVILEK